MTRLALAVLACTAVLGQAAVALAQAKSDGAPSSVKRAHPAPSGSAVLRSAQAELAESFRAHRPTQEEMRAAVAASRAGAPGRREAHVAEARQRYAAMGLGRHEVFEELRIHARRMAYLNRAKVVATTELDEPKRATTIARIDQLTAAEQARHRSRMERLKSAASVPSGAPSGFPAPGPSNRMRDRHTVPALRAPGSEGRAAPQGSAP